jgi:glycosyltransferase involved in cell wall biosynthesis
VLEVQLFHTRRVHFGAHSGIQQFIPHLDRSRVRWRVRGVGDNDDDLPRAFPFRDERARSAAKRLIQRRGQIWYKLSDLAAELSVISPMMRRELDVLHFVDGEHTAQFLPALARLTRVCGRTIATYHQSPAVLPTVVVPAVLKKLDHITLVSSSQLEYFERVVPRNRLSVILHGIDTEFFAPDPARRPSGQFRCITTGSYLRDWPLLAEIARALVERSDIELHVVSASAPAFDLPNVTLHRAIDDEALRALYRQSNLLVLPLTDATANNALLESMATGLPIVASDLPSLREYAPTTAATFLPRDAQAFAATVLALADDDMRRAAMGRAARERAESLAWPRIAEQYASLYERVAHGGRAA